MLFAGNGRHRCRTQAEKAIAAAGVVGVGVGLALPLLTATGAHAAQVDTWDSVAQCESTGDWSINTGNGFYGGLQFTSSTWAAYGGTQYAAQANKATKAQQISVAEKVLASQGPGAWPVCSVKAGLARGGAVAAVDTSDSGANTGSHSGSSDAAPQAKAKPQPTQVQPQPQAEQSSAPAAGTAPTSNSGHDYTVQPGDTLSKIGQAEHVPGGWQAVYGANTSTVGGNPDLILPGQVLHLG